MTTAREPIMYSFDRASSSGYSVSIYLIPDERRERAEKAILAAGVMLPLPHRCSWARAICPHGSLFFAVEDENGADSFGFAAKIIRSRALPGHLQLRVEMFGGALQTDVLEVALMSLKEYAVSNRKVLRVNVEVMSRDRLVRSAIGQYAKALGFCRREKSRSYNRTVVMDLTRDESAIFASLHPTARRHIKITSKKPLTIRAIVDSSYSHRLAELLKETLARTSGGSEKHDWERVIDFSRRYPNESRLVGLFRTDMPPDPDALLSFVWGRVHGVSADYHVAASTRLAGSNVPLGYAPAWDVIRWAKSRGARYFDFGGITDGHHGDSADALGGISDFKRYFTQEVVVVGEEWILEPSGQKAKVANFVSGNARRIREIMHRMSPLFKQ